MVLGNPEREFTSRGTLPPMPIARHMPFSAREKYSLLRWIKAAGAEAEGREFGFTSGEIEETIAHMCRDVQDGMGTETACKGDY